MRLGLYTPILSRVPGIHATWEEGATVSDLVAIVTAAERLGYEHITCGEHVAIPTDVVASRGASWWEPVASLAYMAAVTSRIRLVTCVIVLGYHHPIAVAKASSTLDTLSGGRLTLGVGIGTLREEFEMLGVPFDGRGDRADDALRLLRVALKGGVVNYCSEHLSVKDMVIDPRPVQEHLPIWVGGNTARSLRRAVELGDGWMPFGLTLEESSRLLMRYSSRIEAGRDTVFDVVLNHEPRLLDPLGDRPGATRAIAAVSAVGASIMNVRFVHRSRLHFLEQLEAMAEVRGEVSSSA